MLNIAEWFEEHKAQCWFDDKTQKWTVFIRVKGPNPIQPSRPTFVEAVLAADEALQKMSS